MSAKKILVIFAAISFPTMWHYLEFQATEMNIYRILSFLGLIGTFVTYSYIFRVWFTKLPIIKRNKNIWRGYLTKILAPIVFGLFVIAILAITFLEIDNFILKQFGSIETKCLVTDEQSTTGRRNRLAGYYYFYNHEDKKYPGIVEKGDYSPGDSVAISYSTLFPFIRRVNK